MRRFLVVPGWATSVTDGDRHFIGIDPLVGLYKLAPDEYIGTTIPERYPSDWPRLGPRKAGDYEAYIKQARVDILI